MKKFAAILTFSISTAVISLPASAAELAGYISDAKCAQENAKAPTAASWIHPAVFQSCAKMCVKNGAEVVFLTPENKTVKIDAASMEKVMPLLGHKVTVNGKIDDGVLKVDSVAEAK